jgi:hypothetical protein
MVKHSSDSANDEMSSSVCPFVVEPLSECYCVSSSMQNISRALHICGKGYRECSIYNSFIDCLSETD